MDGVCHANPLLGPTQGPSMWKVNTPKRGVQILQRAASSAPPARLQTRKIDHFEAQIDHFEAKTGHFEAKIDHFEAKTNHFEAKIDYFEATIGKEGWELQGVP